MWGFYHRLWTTLQRGYVEQVFKAYLFWKPIRASWGYFQAFSYSCQDSSTTQVTFCASRTNRYYLLLASDRSPPLWLSLAAVKHLTLLVARWFIPERTQHTIPLLPYD